MSETKDKIQTSLHDSSEEVLGHTASHAEKSGSDIISSEDLTVIDPILDEKNPDRTWRSRGVRRIENVKKSMDSSREGNLMRLAFCLCLLLNSWVSDFESVTVSNYQPYATSSFEHHSSLTTITTASSIITAISKPLIAKFADMTSRPQTYILVLVFYTIGYIVTASCTSLQAYIAGCVFIAVGKSGISLLDTIISADITPLKYRGLLIGVLATPYIINTWFAGLIVNAILNHNWRWGYGMFAIIMPVTVAPSIAIMIYLEHKAYHKQIALGNIEKDKKKSTQEWKTYIWENIQQCDLFGMVLMGFGWSLLLLPFSLRKTADGGWTNPSIIAMFVVGGVLLIIHAIYEWKFAKFPAMPKRMLLNRTFMTAVIIDFMYQLGGGIRTAYWSSYVLVVTNWKYTYWTYYNNTLTMGLCVFGLVFGIILRYVKRAKWIQAFGLMLQFIAKGLSVAARNGNENTAMLVWCQLLGGMGGAGSVVGTQVAAQASVPHQDVALSISLLALWSNIGAAIGSAVAGAIWQSKLPGYLREEMPSSVNDTMVTTYFGSVTAIYKLPYESASRQGAIKAYYRIQYPLMVSSCVLAVIPFIAVFFQKNFYLGNAQNCVEFDEEAHGRDKKEVLAEKQHLSGWKKFKYIMNDPIGYYLEKKEAKKILA